MTWARKLKIQCSRQLWVKVPSIGIARGSIICTYINHLFVPFLNNWELRLLRALHKFTLNEWTNDRQTNKHRLISTSCVSSCWSQKSVIKITFIGKFSLNLSLVCAECFGFWATEIIWNSHVWAFWNGKIKISNNI